MIVELAFGFTVAFMIIAFGSYVGTRIALRSFFGEEFTNADTGRFTLSNADYGETAGDSE